MGRKRTRAGKHLLLCLACLTAVSLAGCTPKDFVRTVTGADNAAQTERVKSETPPPAEKETASRKPPPADKPPKPAPPAEAEAPTPPPEPKVKEKAKAPAEKPEEAPPSDLASLYGKAGEHLVQGNTLLAAGDFKASFAENQKALSAAGSAPPGDIALFNMGLIYAHQDNPEKDYKKSISYFNRLLTEFPGSGLAEQAKIWIGVLEVIEKSKQVDIEIEMKKKELNR